jgi:hypothetical protein
MTAFLQILVSQPLAAAWLGGLVAEIRPQDWRWIRPSRRMESLASPGRRRSREWGRHRWWRARLPLRRRGEPGWVGLTVPDAPRSRSHFSWGDAGDDPAPCSRGHDRRRAFIHRIAFDAAARGGRGRGANLLGRSPAVYSDGYGGAGSGAGASSSEARGPGVGDGRWVAIPVLAVGLGQMASLAGGKRVWAWVGAVLLVGGLSLGAR